ncbi:Guanine nucleotide exchange factor lte1 [Lambiella insularis]|nr:Guanine nucleotide exchange factor lte1 [Lambiella insularis]
MTTRSTGDAGRNGTGVRRKSFEKVPNRERQSSLRRVKDSTDVLRERSSHRQRVKNDSPFDGIPGGREGRQFTVGNVGTNGMIYLRPVNKRPPQPQPPQATPFVYPELERNETQVSESQLRDSVWTHLSTPIRPLGYPPIEVGTDRLTPRSRRSTSESILGDHLTQESLDSGAVKIVIDRAETLPTSETDGGTSLPTIEVPIPHYRLGEPRFSTQGTAFLHSSVYTRSSINEDFNSSLFPSGEYDRLFPRPPGMESLPIISQRQSRALPQPYTHHMNPAPNVSVSSAPSPVHKPVGPILPQIYDALAAKPNDPATVKFSTSGGEIVAATPARIIAQVTSENFLDYELLSDFFLTVRAYLSTQDLLSYLVARFEWAINRFDDNGRVIRVRAFAALRHWILNYFAYDFVMDRDLRVQFCDRLNALTRVVRARANYGASDMKLISDLKKCWNGRCTLYWDSAVVFNGPQHDVDIQPGGIVGSRDSQLNHPSQLQQLAPAFDSLQLAGVGEVTPGSTLENWYNAAPEATERPAHGHNRQSSAVTTCSLPISPSSEQSVPVLSCSISAKSFQRTAPYANQALNIHPVPTNPEGRRVCPAAPSAQANGQPARPVTPHHRRSGSFSDAARDKREPLSSDRPRGSEDYLQISHPYAGSLIRGNVVSPGQPYVSVLAPVSPYMELSSMDSSGTRKYGPQNNPGVRHLLGNIRRALSSKNTTGCNQSSNSVGTTPPASSFSIGKGAAIPMSVMYQAVAAGQLESFRSNSRVDLLAADIVEAFNQAITAQYGGDTRCLNSIGIASGNEHEQPSPSDREPSMDVPPLSRGLAPPDLRRMESGITNGSQSILIADDTGLNVLDIPPVPSRAIGKIELGSQATDSFTVARLPDATLFAGVAPPELPLNANRVNLLANAVEGSQSSKQQNVPGRSYPERQTSYSFQAHTNPNKNQEQSRPSMTYRGQSFKSTRSGSLLLRRYASYQSTFSKHVRGGSVDDTTEGASGLDSATDALGNPTAHVLRRRPGGDLKATQNVHDLEGLTRPKSTGSITTYSDSLRGSDLHYSAGRLNRTTATHNSSQVPPDSTEGFVLTGTRKPASYVRTHSSQPAARRPSFEAAVAEFAQIPDDEEGGIEATLMKLEGRYQKTPVQSPIMQNFPDSVYSESHSVPKVQQRRLSTVTYSQAIAQYSEGGTSIVPASPKHNSDSNGSAHTTSGHQDLPVESNTTRPMIASVLFTESEESYNSTPLLDRGTDQSRMDLTEQFAQSISYNRRLVPSDAMMDTQSMRRLKHGSSAPTVTTDSFLLDEDDDFLSDLSSEMSLDRLDHDGAETPFPQPGTQGTQENTLLVGGHPPSPPMTMENALSISSQANRANEQRRPPTPDPSPVSRLRELEIAKASTATQSIPTMPGQGFKKSRHLCFILGYDSDLLAQQMTIIEKDALNEIDWRDLVDMRWQNSAIPVTNWVDYLQHHDTTGIDLVTARFNVMVKWALSEIILTQHVEERALTIMKYIHVARQARKARNYATLLQLTIALTSTDCTRLAKTWELVPAAEKEILKDLEDLVTPRRNFHNLRQEMEKANAEEGCIPVVALYIHDLTYNSQKPALVAGALGGEPLINFERYRSTALIVKNLLRLIDASSKYTYQPVDGVISRCLWMAALPDETIRIKSKELE